MSSRDLFTGSKKIPKHLVFLVVFLDTVVKPRYDLSL
ncbi:palindromic element RPE4 domain-containing protein [Rickettsia sp.]